MIRIPAVIIAAFLLTACATERSVFEGGTSILAPVANPVSRTSLAQVESTYGIVLSAAVAYRRLPLCRRGQVESFTHVCSRRAVVLELQRADRQARVALLAARSFVRNYPTVNAVQVVGAAADAVREFQNVAAANGVK